MGAAGINFNALHGVRHVGEAASIEGSSKINPYDYFQVIQSLFWLVAYFWHFSRAALALLLDPDLKEWAMRPTVSNCLCCGSAADDDDEIPSGGAIAAGDLESFGQVPLCYVMEVKSEAGEAPASKEGEDNC